VKNNPKSFYSTNEVKLENKYSDSNYYRKENYFYNTNNQDYLNPYYDHS